jgi:hypothetical protein
MPGKRDGEITRLLGAFSNGEPEAEARLMELTYRELRKIAAVICAGSDPRAASRPPTWSTKPTCGW